MTLGGVITYRVLTRLLEESLLLHSHENYFTFPRDSRLLPARLMLTRP
jgi:hypothetical protein